MANIATYVRNLNIADSIIKGSDVIEKSTANEDVAGNTAPLAAFVASQAALVAANAAWVANRQQARQLRTVRNAALAQWRIDLGLLASVTQAITKGDAAKIQSAGFDVRLPASPAAEPVAVEQIEGVKVKFNGIEGHSDITWAPDDNADSYVLETSPDPIGPDTFKYLATVSDPNYAGNGATPGLKRWYRVAGVNSLGQGPWSEPALRPVM